VSSYPLKSSILHSCPITYGSLWWAWSVFAGVRVAFELSIAFFTYSCQIHISALSTHVTRRSKIWRFSTLRSHTSRRTGRLT